MGYFLNPVALRMQLSGSTTFRQLVKRVRGTVVGAQANSEARACPASTPPADSRRWGVVVMSWVVACPHDQRCL